MGVRYSDGISWKVAGTVTSVEASGSTGLSVSGSPITSSGTFQLTLGAELQGLAGLSTLGLVTRTGAGLYGTNPYPGTTTTFLRGDGTWATPPGGGTVTSVGISAGTGIAVSGSPITSSGNMTVSLGTVPIANLSGYPASSSVFLRGDGTWNAAPSQSITLTGAVTGSGSSSIATTLSSDIITSNIQTFEFNSTSPSIGGFFTLQDDATTTPTCMRLQMVGSTLSMGGGYEFTLTTTSGNSNPYFNLNYCYYAVVSGKLTLVEPNIFSIYYPNSTLTFNNYRLAGLSNPVNNQDAVNLQTHNATIWNINTSTTGSLSINRLSGYPASSASFLRGDGSWAQISLSSNVTGSLPISNLSGYPSNASVFLSGNGSWTMPYLNSIPINGQLNLSSYGLTTSGTISATTGTLQANNIAAYSSGSVVFASSITMENNNIGGIGYLGVNNIQAASGSNINLLSNLSMASSSVRIYADNGVNYFYSSGGTWFFVNGLTTELQYSYGYLNSGGNTGTSSGTNAYSISCSARVAASEFNAISSRQIKNVLARGEDIESEALEAFGSLSLAKYEYKDKIAYGDGITYGLIAEEVADVFPHYVHSHQAYVPNILQRAIVKKNKETDAYTLSFEEDIETGTLEGGKVRIFSHDKTLEATLQKSSRRTIRILSPEKLDQEVFVYGTYEECPTLTKNKLFELSMVVLKNVLRRVEKIEKSLETRYNP